MGQRHFTVDLSRSQDATELTEFLNESLASRKPADTSFIKHVWAVSAPAHLRTSVVGIHTLLLSEYALCG